MKKAFYMRLVPGETGICNRIGGLPSHIPFEFSKCADTGEDMAFLAQFYCGEYLDIKDTLCIQIYQCVGIDKGEDPQPIVIKIPKGAPLNTQNIGVQQPEITPQIVELEFKEDPDDIPATPSFDKELLNLYKSKFLGATPFKNAFPISSKVLFQLKEECIGLNFGGLMAIVYLDEVDNIHISLL